MHHVEVVEKQPTVVTTSNGRVLFIPGYFKRALLGYMRLGGWDGEGSCATNVLLSKSEETQRKAYGRLISLT